MSSDNERSEDRYATTISSATAEEWNEEKCLRLIREYRKKPLLWDPKDPLYYKKSLKPDAWEEIGDSVGVTAEACKCKMVILLSSFRREKAKIVHSISNGNDPTRAYTSMWFAFKDMSFLIDKELSHQRRLMGEDLIEESPDETNPSIRQHYEEPRRKKRRSKSHTSTAKRDFAILNTFTEPEAGPSSTSVYQQHQDDDDELKSFTTFIYSKMKKYNDSTKNSVQQAICDVIFRADQQMCDNMYNYNYNYQSHHSGSAHGDDPLLKNVDPNYRRVTQPNKTEPN